MPATSLVRLRCYWLLMSIEQSLGRILVETADVSDPGFLADQQRDRGLRRLQEDFEDEGWNLDDVTNEDLLNYLDLGDLLQLLNRHSGRDEVIGGAEAHKISEIAEQGGLVAIRKRVMHTIRPLEETDLPLLVETSTRIINESTSLNWSQLKQALIQQDSGSFGDFDIPAYWAEDLAIPNNLPSSEFDETGFIGRQRERRQLASRLKSDQRVITLVGEAGTGKTALALRVVNDLVEEGDHQFNRLVWVTLKTRSFTSAGIQEISNAIDTAGGLLRHIFDVLGVNTRSTGWDDVLEEMRNTATLLIIDNLETLGDELRELFLGVPLGSKVLTTSRIGLGEIEERFVLPDFDTGSAVKLFRSLANAYNYKSLLSLSHDEVRGYCGQLDNRPLLIKWFVHAVASGADPNALPAGDDYQEALRFCYENVYRSLSEPAKRVASVLLASRTELSRAQLQELLDIDHVAFQFAIQMLLRSSMTARLRAEDGSSKFKIDGLVRDYLSSNHPPDDDTVVRVRRILREWVDMRQETATRSRANRYQWNLVNVSNVDEQVAQRYLKSALDYSKVGRFPDAFTALDMADRLTPDWWEVPRIRAKVLMDQSAPLYDIEEQFERSVSLTDSDIPRYFYASVLVNHYEYDRAIEHINRALNHPDALKELLLSQRGRANIRLARLDEAIANFPRF